MKRRIVLIVSAVVLALLGTVVVYSYINNADKRALDGVKAVTVLVASGPIPAGTPWGDVKNGKYTTTQSYPASSVPNTALKSTSDLSGVTKFAVQTGQVLSTEMFGAKAAAATGSLTIPGNLQAISVSLPSNADVAGYVQSGSEVAVYSIVQTAHPVNGSAVFGTQQYSSKLLLPQTEVLAVSQSTGSGNSGASGALLVTLAVSQKDAERLVLAQKVGDVYLSLLSSSSASKDDGGTVNLGFFNPSPLFTK